MLAADRHRPGARSRRVTAVVAAVAAALPIAALGHAILVESVPREGQTISTATTQAVLKFNARIEKRVTQVTLRDARGQKMKRPPMPQDDDGPAERIIVPLPKLDPGDYVMEYQVLASDGHATPGIIRFSVAPTAAAPASQPAPDPQPRGNAK